MPRLHLFIFNVVAAFCILPYNAHAVTVMIDEFSIVKNGNMIFYDSFDNNVPPPDTGGNTQDYQIYGGPLGPESGGKLTLPGGGESTSRPDAGTMLREGARVRTSIDPLQPTNGLRIDDLFSVTGIFDISIPTNVRERYGVRFTDGSSSAGNLLNNSVGISVMRTSTSLVEVALHHYDQTAFTFTDIAKITLETNHDQIALTLSRLDVSNNEITASFAYIDAGVMGSTTSFSTTVPIFDGEDFTRAAFMHLTPVPLPPTVWLFGSGLLGLIGISRRKKVA